MATIVKRGKGYQAKIRRDGFPPITKTFERKFDAQAWARQMEARMDGGKWRDERPAEATSVATLLESYERQYVPRLKCAAVETYRVRRLTAELGRYSVTSLTPPILARWRNCRLKAGAASSTVNRELTTLSSAYTWAQKDLFLNCDNPVKGIRRPPEPKGRDRRLLPEEERRLLEVLSAPARKGARRKNPFVLPIISLALETAMRRGELLSLRWEHIDLEAQVAHLPVTKNGHPRDVPLSNRAVEILKDLLPMDRGESGLVFPTSQLAVRQAFERAIKKARDAYETECRLNRQRPNPKLFNDLRFHDLRHEATSRIAIKIPNLIELSSVTGHRDLRSLKRYYHPRASDLAKKLG